MKIFLQNITFAMFYGFEAKVTSFVYPFYDITAFFRNSVQGLGRKGTEDYNNYVSL